MSLDRDADVGLVAQDVSGLIQNWTGIGQNVALVEVEVDAAQHDALARWRWRRRRRRCWWGWGRCRRARIGEMPPQSTEYRAADCPHGYSWSVNPGILPPLADAVSPPAAI